MAGKSVAMIGILFSILLANAAAQQVVPHATAKVSVKLINITDGNQVAKVYGWLAARNSDSPQQTMLFQKSATNKNLPAVERGQLIPLSRAVVKAVPLDSTLTIQADLWDYNTWSGNAQIAEGSAVFRSQSSGTYKQSITGAYGKIQVNVIWN